MAIPAFGFAETVTFGERYDPQDMPADMDGPSDVELEALEADIEEGYLETPVEFHVGASATSQTVEAPKTIDKPRSRGMYDSDDNYTSSDWQDGANCKGVDPDLFFPERGSSTREAKEVCRGCIVRENCLEFALQNGEKFGIWGGLSERERRRIRRQRAQAARSIVGA